MGAWGPGSFENDDALDFASEIESLADVEAVLVAANKEGHALILEPIDAVLSSQIIVAGEVMAAMRGHRSDAMPADLAKTVHGFGRPTVELFDFVRNNVSAVMSRSELLDLWAEAEPDDKKAFNRAMTDLVDRLNLPQRDPDSPPEKAPLKEGDEGWNASPCSFCDAPMGPDDSSMFDITVSCDEISSMKQGGWAHIACLNAALHPKHMIQNWQLDDELLDLVMKRIEAEREARGG